MRGRTRWGLPRRSYSHLGLLQLPPHHHPLSAASLAEGGAHHCMKTKDPRVIIEHINLKWVWPVILKKKNNN